MVFVVPQQKHTLDSLLERMSSNDLYTIMNTGEDYKCAIGIPKFNVTFDLSLTDVLQEVKIILLIILVFPHKLLDLKRLNCNKKRMD